jgi:hypothetical protein
MSSIDLLDGMDLGEIRQDLGTHSPPLPDTAQALPQYLYTLEDESCAEVQDTEIQIRDLQLQQDLIRRLEAASLAEDKLPDHVRERIHNPDPRPISMSPCDKSSLKFFLATHAAPKGTYDNVCQVNKELHPEDGDLLSYHNVKQKLEELTGVVSVSDDICVNSCIAFVGPYENLDVCPVCTQARYKVQESTPTPVQ